MTCSSHQRLSGGTQTEASALLILKSVFEPLCHALPVAHHVL